MANFYNTTQLNQIVTSLESRPTYRAVLQTAVEHARGLITDDFAEEATPLDLRRSDEILSSVAPVEVSDAELESFCRVVSLGAEYMHNNHYANDPSFPEDAAASAVLGSGDHAESVLRYALSTPGNDL